MGVVRLRSRQFTVEIQLCIISISVEAAVADDLNQEGSIQIVKGVPSRESWGHDWTD